MCFCKGKTWKTPNIIYYIFTMKKQLHILSKLGLSLSVFFSFYGIVFWEVCETQEWYELYLCRVETTCDRYEPDTRVFNTSKEERIYLPDDNLTIAKNTYRENMNDIYTCAILKAQNNAYRIYDQKWLKTPYSGTLDARIDGQAKRIAERIDRLDCLKTEIDHFFFKKNILDGATFEMCRYLNFLEYIGEKNVDNIANMLKDEEIKQETEEIIERDPDEWRQAYRDLSWAEDYEFKKPNYTVWYIVELEKESRDELAKEILHTKRVYSVAYQTYANYENNLIIHILLEVIENDFIQLRDKLYATISPINQVVYKVANAMSK